MRAWIAISKREFASYWRTPTGWLVCAIFAAISALVLSITTLQPVEVASMRSVFSAAHWMLLVICPAISMRLIAEEDRTGTLEVLMSSPASDWSISAGKFCAALAVVIAALLTTIPALIVLSVLAPLEAGPLVSGYIGVILAGGLYISVGMLCSTLTNSQVTAFLITVCVMAAWNALPLLSNALSLGPLEDAIEYINIGDRLASSARGVLDSADTAFFLTVWWIGIAGTTAVLTWRRLA